MKVVEEMLNWVTTYGEHYIGRCEVNETDSLETVCENGNITKSARMKS